LSSPLLNDNEIRGASNILLNITSGSEEISMDEVSEITDYIQSEAGSMADIIFGVVKDESIGNQINITLVATGFESGSEQIYPSSKEKDSQKVIHTLITENNSIETKNKTIVNEENFSEIKLKQPVNSSKNEISTNNTSEKSIELELFSYNSDSKPNKNNKIIQPFIHSNSENNELFLDVNKISENIEENAIQTDEDTLKKSKERIQKLRELSIKLKSPNGLQEMEQIPAYLRKNITLAEVVPSSESQISRLSLNEGDDNKVEIKSNNSFLHDNVD